MKAKTLFTYAVFSIILALLTAGKSVAAQTEWRRIAPGATLRLFATNQQNENDISWAALQIRLDKGVKTYWRIPGETGIPLALDWSQSRNIEDVTVNWQFPKTSLTYGFLDYIYEGEVTLPLALKLPKNTQEVTLNLQLNLGICSDVCIPVNWHGSLQMNMAKPSIANQFRIDTARARVPQNDMRADAPFGKVKIDKQNNQLLLVAAKDPLSNASLIVNLPDSGLLFGLPHSRPESGLLFVQGLQEFDLSTLADQQVQLIYDSEDGPFSRFIQLELVN